VIQIVALYNYNALAGVMVSTTIEIYLQLDTWVASNPLILHATTGNVSDAIRVVIGGSEVSALTVMLDYGFCMTPEGFLYLLFNLCCGFFFIYLFIFADVWRVIFATTITRSFPGEPNYYLCLFGVFWLVILNALVLTWLGVESGFSVIASGGEFDSVLFNSLSIFIILGVDETLLPTIRFLIEDIGHLDKGGNLSEDRLSLITHGCQYYKPGYGQHWVRTMTRGLLITRLIAFINFAIAATIVVAPLAVSISFAANSVVRC